MPHAPFGPSPVCRFKIRRTSRRSPAFVSWKFGDDPSAHIEWIKRYWTTLEPFTHGHYANDQEPGVPAAVANANYRENFDRLVALKNRYDPTNLFRLTPTCGRRRSVLPPRLAQPVTHAIVRRAIGWPMYLRIPRRRLHGEIVAYEHRLDA